MRFCLVVCAKNSWSNFGVKARIIEERKLRRIKLIRSILRSLRSSILRSFHARNYLKNFWHRPLALFTVASLWASPASDAYFEAFPDLSAKERWEQIVLMGEEALSADLSPSESAKIHGQIASSYFYLGQFRNTERHAQALLELDRQSVHGMYLLSAAARAIGEFARAKELATEALPLSSGETRAKVCFNLGAAEMEDPQGNLVKGSEALEEALSLFSCPADRARSAIRLGKIALMQGDSSLARARLAQAEPGIASERIRMQALYLSAQIERADGNGDRAKNAAEEALGIAEKLGAKADAKRIIALVESL